MDEVCGCLISNKSCVYITTMLQKGGGGNGKILVEVYSFCVLECSRTFEGFIIYGGWKTFGENARNGERNPFPHFYPGMQTNTILLNI